MLQYTFPLVPVFQIMERTMIDTFGRTISEEAIISESIKRVDTMLLCVFSREFGYLGLGGMLFFFLRVWRTHRSSSLDVRLVVSMALVHVFGEKCVKLGSPPGLRHLCSLQCCGSLLTEHLMDISNQGLNEVEEIQILDWSVAVRHSGVVKFAFSWMLERSLVEDI